jgi:hypothetical protein
MTASQITLAPVARPVPPPDARSTASDARAYYVALRRTLPPAVRRTVPSAAHLADARRERAARAERRERQPLHARFEATLLRRYVAEIRARGGEVAIEGRSSVTPLEIVHRHAGMSLLRADGWRYYSSRFGARPATIAYLCGFDDNGPWAVRVAGTCTSVHEALEQVEPRRVREARLKGRRVLRQGDVYAIERARGDRDDTRALPAAHHWDPRTRVLTHAPETGRAHRPLHVPFPATFVAQSVRGMGRGGRRGVAGD